MIGFMLDLRFNNNKTFMDEHREQYHQLMRDPYYAFIETAAPAMRTIDDRMEVRPYKALSRIYRDTRFTKDKSPYRDHHWLTFRREGEPREKSLMFWLEIRVERISWGLGFWGENKPAMDIFRRRMLAYPDDVMRALPDTGQGSNLQLAGDQYKRMSVPESLLTALKPWYLQKELLVSRLGIDHQIIYTRAVLDEFLRDCDRMAPLYRMLRGCYDQSLIMGEI